MLSKLTSKHVFKNLVHWNKMSLYVKPRKYVDPDVIKEKEEFNQAMIDIKKKYKQEFIADSKEELRQSVENYKKDRIAKYNRDLVMERHNIINVAMHTHKLIKSLNEKEIEDKQKSYWRDLRQMQRFREREMYIKAVEVDMTPPSPPPAVLDHGHYYERLQNLAMLAEQGRYEEMEKVLKNEDIVNEKNLHLVPIFRNIKK